ncbi:hypothetical protein BDZ94DRAFT_1258025 [Collybia nuda]|uniref:Uncharacterized protein n=1 Tax=Collybia nuda TaxID=64659 RepID=A0A9P6CIY7_9AGAR|nr:hypothetical protein BDZ94DRAFT_1258025 [Collybia nuda]
MNVVVVMNMWNKVTQAEGEGREKELKGDERFFKHAVSKKAIFGRHDNTLESAERLVRMVLSNEPKPLIIQKELVNQNKPFFRTSVGEEINRDLQDRIQKQREEMGSIVTELAEAKRDKDKKSLAELSLEKKKIRIALVRYQKEAKNLMSDYQKQKKRAMKSLESGKKEARRLFCM